MPGCDNKEDRALVVPTAELVWGSTSRRVSSCPREGEGGGGDRAKAPAKAADSSFLKMTEEGKF